MRFWCLWEGKKVLKLGFCVRILKNASFSASVLNLLATGDKFHFFANSLPALLYVWAIVV